MDKQLTNGFRISPQQKRLWQLQDGKWQSAYQGITLVSIAGDLKVDGLKSAIETVVERHEILRTRLQQFPGIDLPVQVIEDDRVSLPLVELDLEASPDGLEIINAKLPGIISQSIDFGRDYPLQTVLFKQSSRQHWLAIGLPSLYADRTSLQRLVSEIADAYASLPDNGDEPEDPLQYADLSEWLHELLESEDTESGRVYWQKRTPSAVSPGRLPFEKGGRLTEEPFIPQRVTRTVGTDITRRIQSLLPQEQTTPAVFWLTCWEALLRRLTEQSELVIGVAYDGRTYEELQDAIGAIAKYLPFERTLAEGVPFSQCLATAAEVDRELHHWQEYFNWEQVLPTREGLFTYAYGFDFTELNAPIERDGIVFSIQSCQSCLERFRVRLSCTQTPEALHLTWDYDPNFYEKEAIEILAGQYQTLVDWAVRYPETPIQNIPLLSETQRQKLQFDLNNTQVDYPQCCVQDLFDAQVQRTPEAIAVVFDHQTLTYAELNRRANQLAHYLQKQGVVPETLVAICLERSLELTIALLGILKAGGAYVPLDPAYPQQRLDYMLEDAQARILITQEHLVHRFSEFPGSCLCLDLDWDRSIAPLSVEPPHSTVQPENLAYTIYTSGSTGKPKGVTIAHRNLVNYLSWCLQTYPIAQGTGAPVHSSIGFDATITSLFTPLLGGKKVVLLPEREEIEALKEILCTQGNFSLVKITPAHLEMLERLLPDDDMTDRTQAFIIGGEALLGKSVRWWRKFAPQTRMVNEYGPSETVVGCCVYDVCDQTDLSGVIPIGRPIANTQIYILDDALEIVPTGVPGEIYIGGAGVGRGYRHRPDLTADRFVPDPFAQTPGARLYRTGDSARYLPNGDLEFLGRIDDQVKIRSFRIELGEIEAVLSQHRAVQERAVTVREEEGDRYLVAYVVADAEVAHPQTQAEEWSNDRVERWKTIYKETYGQSPTHTDLAFNIAGWTSSYTGELLSDVQMQEWVEQTVARIRALEPKQVLEIGSGTGLLLSRIAPHCQRYDGTDFSPEAIDRLHRLKAARSDLAHVSLWEKTAADLSGFEPATYDTIIINSVIQYFPSVAYLLEVLRQAITLLGPGGHLFIGDVRSLPLLEAYHGSVQLARGTENLSREQLQQRIGRQLMEEEELVVDPDFFRMLPQHLPQIGAVRIQLKRGRHQNELTRFRYDVVLQVGSPASTSETLRWIDWTKDPLHPEAVRQRLLEQRSPEGLGIRGIPNPRLQADLALLKWLSEAPADELVGNPQRFVPAECDEIDPNEWWDCFADLPYTVTVTWSAIDRGCYDAIVTPGSHPIAAIPNPSQQNHQGLEKPWDAYANNPLQGKLTQKLVPQLRQFIGDRLPDYMVPKTIVLLESLPLTPNGKVDRRSLPVPALSRTTFNTVYVAPRTASEERLANLWAEILGVEKVGLEDNFFELGGHSLLATQLISRIRDAFKVELPVRSLFESPTVAQLHAAIEQVGDGGVDAFMQPIQPTGLNREAPLSFSQQRLWFLSQIDGGNAAYNMPMAVKLSGNLNVEALKQSLEEVVRRHGTLRTTFKRVDGIPQQVLDGTIPPLVVLDLQDVPTAGLSQEIERLMTEEGQSLFNLETGPLVRVKLLRLHPQEHIFLLTMHHIISDGWSIGVLIREIARLYKAFSEESPLSLDPLPIQYVDFSHWQRRVLQPEVLERWLSDRTQKLAGLPTLLQLPTDFPRPPMQSFRGGRVRFQLSSDLTQRVRDLSGRSQSTVFMTLLAAFVTLLFRYSEQDDIVVGSPIANRNRSETEALIGFFVNTLILRVQPSGDLTFSELLKQVRQVCLDAYAHQDLPFDRLVEALKPERSLSHNPLFQVMFALQTAPDLEELELRDLKAVPLETDNVAAMFDLSLLLEETASQIVGSWEYSRDLFAAETISRMVGHFQQLLNEIVLDPERRLSELTGLSDSEFQQLVVDWNHTQRSYPSTSSIHCLFEAQVRRTPEAIALCFEEQQISYRELNQRANQLARYLETVGVGTETLVGICMERSPQLLVGLLAILKAGGTYVPIDPNYPRERQTSIVSESGIEVILTGQQAGAHLSRPGLEMVDLGEIQGVIDEQSPTNLAPLVADTQLAYVLYTSGSTGVPKGVAIEHRSVVAFLYWAQEVFSPSQLDGVLAATSICFDLSVFELFLPLACGGRIVLVENAIELATLSSLHKVSLVNTVPSAITELLNLNGIPESVRIVNLAGEPLPAQLVQRLYQHPSIERVFNLYGPSEDTTYSTGIEISRSNEQIPSIGRPIANTQAYVLDRALQPVPIGVPGELYLGGSGLARGYLHRPDLTADRFLPNPLGNVPGARLYKTGDLVRYRANGELEYLGRRDYLVKIRGFRIELGEIEAVLRQHSQVQNAVVVVASDSKEGAIAQEKRLVAYIVPHLETPNLIQDLRQFLQERLPSYEIPAQFVVLDAFPLTPNGKINRQALPDPTLNPTERTQTFVPPRSPLEFKLVRIWEKVLKTQPVSVRDNFFDIGGHSLLAVRAMSAIHQQLGYELPLSTLFQAPSVEQLALHLETQTQPSKPSIRVCLQPEGTHSPFFCVPGIGGNILYFYDLVRHLGTEFPVYGFQAQGLDGYEPHTSLEEMAQAYIESLRQVQPQGPYYLGGHSFGGWVAFEMAQQLQQCGQSVAMLAIFDAVAPNGDEPHLGQDWDDAQWFVQIARMLEESYGYGLALSYESLQTLDAEAQLAVMGERLQSVGLLPLGDRTDWVRRLLRVFKTNAQIRYVPKTLHKTPVHLFKVDESLSENHGGEPIDRLRQNPTLGWENLVTTEIVTHVVPGTHTSMMADPHVRVLAASLKALLM